MLGSAHFNHNCPNFIRCRITTERINGSYSLISLSRNLHRILGKKKVAELLIRNGVDINHMDNNNQTALHRAASQGNI